MAQQRRRGGGQRSMSGRSEGSRNMHVRLSRLVSVDRDGGIVMVVAAQCLHAYTSSYGKSLQLYNYTGREHPCAKALPDDAAMPPPPAGRSSPRRDGRLRRRDTTVPACVRLRPVLE